jgi:2-oxoglutarate dehydrogenase E1 component
MFHMIRRQAKSNFAKPLVIFLSKRLLRAKEAMSDLNSITDGVFLPVIADDSAKKTANRVIFCTGQVYYDLLKARAEKNLADSVAIVRVEQLYPFPAEQVKAEVAKYAKAKDFVWAQEEPYNQGAWLQIREDLDEALGGKAHFKAASRPRAAAPACGTSTMHNQQLADLLAAALTK